MKSWEDKPVKNAKRLIRDLCYKSHNEVDVLSAYIWLLGTQRGQLFQKILRSCYL